MNYNQLTEALKYANETLVSASVKAVNINITIRNWLFGFYIVVFEQNGDDRAKYGKKLLQNIANEINIKGLTAPELSRCRQFYNTYPQILGLMTQKTKTKLFSNLLTGKIDVFKNSILGLPTQEFQSSDLEHIEKIITVVSYTHFTELIKIDDIVKRKFYELLILKTTPSVKELKRQIETLAFERLGLSGDKNVALSQLENKVLPSMPTDVVKSHYFFDFLNINHTQLIEESELEQALINHLQSFIIEMGNGFCFEARQKRILIGDEYFFIDLVFYHRILKCHVLIELKTEKAKHEHIGQLKAYIQHYKKNIISKDDNPPVGILLVTDQNKTLVEYAIAESDKEIFVSKYLLQLPDKEKLAQFIENELKEL